MRLLLTPLTAIAALGIAAPSLAADTGVTVKDFEFDAKSISIDVGDSVTWNFQDGGHTTTARPGQPQRWDSDLGNAGASFQQTFSKPGRYQYICIPHASFMSGTITVGQDAVAKTVTSVKAKVSGAKVTFSFKLNEPATVGLKLKGAAKRTVKAKRLAAGKHSVAVKGLKAGSYSGTVALSDDFDKKTTQKKSFTVR
jgi:plastocyanin